MRLQPTYEELKLHLVELLLQAPDRLQPTYEELKPIPGSHHPWLAAVSSLPMRN